MKLFPSANESSLQIGFLTLLALLVSTTPRISDIANRGFFFLKLCFFAILFYSLFPAATLDNLWNEPSTTLPLNTFIIFFTSFGFHGSIPVFVEYMNHQSTKRIKTAFWIGSALPLLAYLGWQTISLAALSPLQKLSVENNPENLGFFIEQLHQVTSNASLNFFITGFSLLAIITSFIGVGLGHFQLIKEQLSLTKIPTNRLLLIILTFGVPLFICLFYPKAFLAALKFAGITLCLIAIVLPTLISWKLKRHSKIVLSLLLLISTIIIGTELQRWL